MQFALGPDGDLLIQGGRLQLVTGRDATVQRLKTRLRTFRGEWEYDERIGVPYFESVLKKRFEIRVVANLLRGVILGTDGIQRLRELNFDFDSATRALEVEVDAQDTAGDSIALTFSEVLV